jgi:hypothetical protein
MAANSTNPEPAAVVESPFCGALRSKQFFFYDGLATSEADYLDATGHCWCAETQLVVGPDGSKAKPGQCVPGRACYRSALATP